MAAALTITEGRCGAFLRSKTAFGFRPRYVPQKPVLRQGLHELKREDQRSMVNDSQLAKRIRLVACLAVIVAIAATPLTMSRPARAQEGAFDPDAFAVRLEL